MNSQGVLKHEESHSVSGVSVVIIEANRIPSNDSGFTVFKDPQCSWEM